MVVDFDLKRARALHLATVTWTAPWSDKRTRSEFERLARWLADRKIKGGRWVFESDGSDRRFTAGIEVPARVKGDGRVRVRSRPASRIATVTFDPDVVSPRVVYHGISDWLRWRKKEKAIKSFGAYREVYSGNPWTDKKAWAHTEIQVVVR
jgi:hypothetical protein